ncbi:MAG: DUF835 domain-containing protein [Methanobacteriota archaeon]|nr:MAG: DUF835 domain-containing protein [Euryarchaeota archaeon]
MRRSAPLMAFILSVCLAAGLPGIASSQDGTDAVPGMVVNTSMQLTSIGDLDGSGTVTITFRGDPAREFRGHVLSEFDSDMNQMIEADEARSLLMALSSALDGKPYWGVAMEPSGDVANVTEATAESMTAGLVLHSWHSTDDVSVRLDFQCRGEGFSKVIFIIQPAVDAFRGAVLDATGYAFDGLMRLEHRVVAFGVGAFTDPDMTNGTIQELRTPAGVVIWYTSEFEVDGSGSASQETISYEELSVVENPQVAFVVLFIGSLVIARLPAKRFEKFRKLHPKRYRKYARPRLAPKVLAVALLAVLWVLYAMPFLMGYVFEGFILYSYYFLFLVPVAMAGQHAVTRYVYAKSSLDIPEETVVEIKQAQLAPDEPESLGLCAVCFKPIESEADMHTCDACSIDMHVECAQRARVCPSCEEILFPQDTRSIECKACGESFLHSGMEDAYSIQCTRCGAFQEEVVAGKNYLVVDEDPTMAYRMIRAMGLSGRAAMAMTIEFPGKIRADYELGEEVDVRWFSESTTDIDNVNPQDLEGDAMETASTFLATTKRAGLLVDGIDQLIDLNDFDKVVAFIRRLNDLAAIHGSTIIIQVDKSKMDEDAYDVISEEFDEIHDYT